MKKRCFFCDKKPSGGNTVQMRGMAKKKGGVGKKITSTTKRKFKPNLQKVKAYIKGDILQIWACAKCLKKGRVKKPSLSLKKPAVAASQVSAGLSSN